MKFRLRKTNYLDEFAYQTNEMHWCQELTWIWIQIIVFEGFQTLFYDDLVFQPMIHATSIRSIRMYQIQETDIYVYHSQILQK